MRGGVPVFKRPTSKPISFNFSEINNEGFSPNLPPSVVDFPVNIFPFKKVPGQNIKALVKIISLDIVFTPSTLSHLIIISVAVSSINVKLFTLFNVL